MKLNDIEQINEALTRKDFIKFAKMMKSVKKKGAKEMWRTVMDTMIEIFQDINPQFKPDMFKKAATDTSNDADTTELTEAKEISAFDNDILKGNRIKLNRALQDLDSALRNYASLEDKELNKFVNMNIKRSRDLITKTNIRLTRLK